MPDRLVISSKKLSTYFDIWRFRCQIFKKEYKIDKTLNSEEDTRNNYLSHQESTIKYNKII